MDAEFSAIEDELASRGDMWDSITGEVDGLLSAAHEGTIRELSLEQLEIATWALLFPSTYDPGSGVRDALIASGRLEMIEDPEQK